MKQIRTQFMRVSVTGGYTLSDPFQAPYRLRLVGVGMVMAVLDVNNGAVSFFHLTASPFPTGDVPLSGAPVLASLLAITNVASAVGTFHSNEALYMPLFHEMVAGERVWLFGGCSGTTAICHACLHYAGR